MKKIKSQEYKIKQEVMNRYGLSIRMKTGPSVRRAVAKKFAWRTN